MKKIYLAYLFIALTATQYVHSANTGNDTIPYSAQLLSDYIQHESITGNEMNAGLYLASMARLMGMHVEVLTNGVDTFNFAASLYPLSLNKPNIILLNHIDVVPAEKDRKSVV